MAAENGKTHGDYSAMNEMGHIHKPGATLFGNRLIAPDESLRTDLRSFVEDAFGVEQAMAA